MIITPCARLRLTSLSRLVTILWSCGCSGCWLLAIGWVGRLGAVCRLSCIRGLRCGDGSSGGVISPSAISLDRLAVRLGGSWSGITSGRLSIRSCICSLPVGGSALSLGIADISRLSIGSIALLPICLGGLCISLTWLGSVSTVTRLSYRYCNLQTPFSLFPPRSLKVCLPLELLITLLERVLAF